jgi:hypothetical protein
LEQTASRIREKLETKRLTEEHRRDLQNYLHDLEQMIEPPVFSPLLPPDTNETEIP